MRINNEFQRTQSQLTHFSQCSALTTQILSISMTSQIADILGT